MRFAFSIARRLGVYKQSRRLQHADRSGRQLQFTALKQYAEIRARRVIRVMDDATRSFAAISEPLRDTPQPSRSSPET